MEISTIEVRDKHVGPSGLGDLEVPEYHTRMSQGHWSERKGATYYACGVLLYMHAPYACAPRVNKECAVMS